MKRNGMATAAFALFLLSVASGSARSAPDAQACHAADGRFDVGLSLPHVAERLAEGRPVTIVALGSSSTAGAGASTPARTYPAQLESDLRGAWPAVAVINKGVNGETSADELRRMDRDVLAAAPDLVIWQVGTNFMLRHDGLGNYAATLREGIARIRAHDADVLLLDPQYAPRVLADADHQAMVAAIGQVATEEHIGLFRRYDLMRSWIDAGGLGFSDFLMPDGLHMNDWAYACLARLLAGSLRQAVEGGRAAQSRR